jgi:hypothetical protein
MTKKISWTLFVTTALLIGFYPAIYFVINRNFGLLSSKSSELLSNISWNIAFYIHIIFGGLALLSGWIQFNSSLRIRKPKVHKNFGKFYVVAVILSSIAGIYIGIFATGGFISAFGFISLGIIWFYTTFQGYVKIKNKLIADHQKLMIYSYAACFAAVTLRIWLPLLIFIVGDFMVAYRIVAWLCWIPNLIMATHFAKRVQ